MYFRIPIFGLAALAIAISVTPSAAQDPLPAAALDQGQSPERGEKQPASDEPAESSREALFRRSDRNNDGKLSFLEAFPDKRPSEKETEKLRKHLHKKMRCQEAFRATDRDQSGELSLVEFEQGEFALSALGSSKSALLPDPVLELVEAIVASAFRDRGAALSRWEWERLPWSELSQDLEGFDRENPSPNPDQDGNGAITRDEARRVIEIAFGARRPDGAPTRSPNGDVFVNMYFDAWDVNHDDKLSLEEFAPKSSSATMSMRMRRLGTKAAPQPKPETPESKQEAAARLFGRLDADHDGFATPAEMFEVFADDRIGIFLNCDKNLDGRIEQEELLAHAKLWKPESLTTIFAALDEDRNGSLSFREYCFSPFLNRARDWHRKRKDLNRDALLSYEEFRLDPGLFASALSRRFYRMFDQNHDGTLSYGEFPFETDRSKIPPDAIFQVHDRNRDGKLALGEVFTEAKPSASEKSALQRYEMRLGVAETRFLADDKDRDGGLSVAEFQQSREAALAAVERKTRALTRHRQPAGDNWFYSVVLTVNVLVLLGGGWYLIRRSM